MTSKKILVTSALISAVIGFVTFTLFTPLGVHFYGEVLFGGDDNARTHGPTSYPTAISETRTARTLPIPPEISQPSGIEYDKVNDRFLVVTDQAEIFELSSDFRTVHSSQVTSPLPLFFRQGSVESADYHGDQLFVSGDRGVVETWRRDGDGWGKAGVLESTSSFGAEGMAIHPEDGDIYVAEDDTIHVLDPDGQYTRTLTLKAESLPGRALSEYSIAGLDFHGETLFAVTEYHSAILAIDPASGAIVNSWALDGITEGAGLVVTDDTFYVVVDHELTEPSPGIKAFAR